MVTFEDFDGDRLYDPSSEPKVLLGPVRFSGRDVNKAIAKVISMPSAPPRWQVELVLNQEGTRVFRAVTSELAGRQLAMVVNGVVLSAPTIQATITSGRGTITGRFTERQAKELAAALTQPVG